MTPPTDHRALSARVAVEVMGWTLTDDGLVWFDGKQGECLLHVSEWLPTESWSDAGLVVEEMRRKGWDVSIRNERDGYICVFTFPLTEAERKRDEMESEIKYLGMKFAPTLPLSVSLAALAAVAAGKETTGEVQST